MHLLKAPEIQQTFLEDQQLTTGSQQFPVHLLGDARGGSNITRTCSFQAVDQTALSHVWEAYQRK